MAIEQTITEKEAQAVDRADRTGLSDSFSYAHEEEVTASYDFDIDNDFIAAQEQERQPGGRLFGLTMDEIQLLPPTTSHIPQFKSDEFRKKGIFERMFGYNPEQDMPAGYEKMGEFERLAYKGQLAAHNIFTRAGVALTEQLSGTIKLLTPESIEQYLPTAQRKDEVRLEEDKQYELRIQSELRKKKASGLLSPDEAEQLSYLDETLPKKSQRVVEFGARAVAEVERIALANTIFQAIPGPGGSTLSDFLSQKGKQLGGNWLAAKAADYSGKKAISAGLDSLAKQVVNLGPNAGELFVWGAIAEDPEEGEDALVARTEAGAKMTAWAVAPLVLAPSGAAAVNTKTGAVATTFLQRAITKAVSPIADRLAKMTANQAKNTFVNQALIEADELSRIETGKPLTAKQKVSSKAELTKIADDTVEIAKQDAATINTRLEELTAQKLSKTPVGEETVVPAALRKVETVTDNVVNNTAALVEARTGFVTIKQPNGRYAILDKNTLQEVAVDIKRKNLSSELSDIIFGVGKKAPKKHRLDVTTKPPKDLTISSKAELKRSLKVMEKATNNAYRAGAKEGAAQATEKANIKIQASKERLKTVRAGHQAQWKNVEFARELVKDYVPKAEQHRFMNRLIKARTEGGVEKVLDDIEKFINVSETKNAVQSLRDTLKVATNKYGDKTGKFAKAPDEIRPVLESIDSAVGKIKKISPTATGEIEGIGQLADDMIGGLQKAISGKGEILGIPEALADDLYNLTTQQGDKMSSDQINTMVELAKVVLHRAENAQMIKIGPHIEQASKAIDDSVDRIIPRPAKAKPKGMKGKVEKLVGVESDNPITLINKMFGDGSDMSVLLDDLYQGEVEAFGVMRNSFDFMKTYMRENQINPTIFDDLKKTVDVKIGGQSVKITRDELLGMAMSTRDPWVFDQMTKTVGYRLQSVGDIAPATLDELSEMFAKLTPDEWKLGSMMFELNNSYLNQVVNETSLAINGTKLATYPQYYPSHRALNEKLYGNKFAFKTAETQSNFMPRMGGKGRMRFNSYSREMLDYTQNSAMYNGTAVPMRSMKTVMADKNLQTQLKNGGYSDELSAFTTILARSEGMYSDASVLDSLGSEVLNRFTKSVLGGRVSTIGTQIASVPAAKSIIPAKHFRAEDLIPDAKAVDDLMTSDFFWHRWQGRRVSVELGDAASKSSIGHFITGKIPVTEKPLNGLVWGDKRAIQAIYKSARRFISDTQGLAGDNLTAAAVKMTEDVTRRTQPNWSVLTRSKLATDPSLFKRSLTMFRTAQEQQLNIWKQANATFARSPKGQADMNRLVDSYQAVLESQLTVAIWKTMWKRGRNAGIAGTAGWLGVYTPQNEDPLSEDMGKNIARSTAGMFPLGQMVESSVELAYDKIFKDEFRFNSSSDPFSSIGSAVVAAGDSATKVVKKWIKDKQKREGFTADFIPTDLDDLLNEIATSESDKELKKNEFNKAVFKAVSNSLRATGVLTGLPVGPLDEWVAPALKRSSHPEVRRVTQNNSSDPAALQKNLHKFLEQRNDLAKKEEQEGLNAEEAQELFDMNLIMQITINPLLAVDEVIGESQQHVLDPIQEELKDFFGK